MNLIVADQLFDAIGQRHDAIGRRMERSDQEAVVAAGVAADDRRARITAPLVREQPLAIQKIIDSLVACRDRDDFVG
jgi:hypothetical protein